MRHLCNASIWIALTGLPAAFFYLSNYRGFASRLDTAVSDLQPAVGALLPFIAIAVASLSTAALAQVVWPVVQYFNRRRKERHRHEELDRQYLEEQIRLDEEAHLDAINEGPTIRWLKGGVEVFSALQRDLLQYYELMSPNRVLYRRDEIERETMAVSVRTKLEKLFEKLYLFDIHCPPTNKLDTIAQIRTWATYMAEFIVLAGLGDLKGVRELGSKCAPSEDNL